MKKSDKSINITLINDQLTNNKKKYDNNEANQTKIVSYDFFSMNEINISKIIIDKIPYNKNNYDMLIDYNFIDISEISEKVIENVDLDSDTKYIICSYAEKRIGFSNFLFNFPDIKQFISNILNTYSILLDSLIKLNKNNICFFELSVDNIVFSPNTRPLLKITNNSLIVSSNLNESYIKNIINNIDNYTYKPLEVHVLFYLIVKNEETLSLSFIEDICNNYVKNMNILTLFSQNYKDSYEKACVETLKKYINKPKSVIIVDILNYNKYWDNYSLSILYLHVIGNISKFFSLKGTFMNKFTLLLIKNIHPNPLKRETLEETNVNYNKLFDEDTDWSFINYISYKKLKKLYNLLSN